MKNKVKIYISHSIRGKDDIKATKEVKDANNQKAMLFAKNLRKHFPNVLFYCPAEHEDWIQRALNKNIITIKDILNIDCDIVSEHHILLVYSHDQYLSRGMLWEIQRAQHCGIPIIIAEDIIQAVYFLKAEFNRMMVG